MSLSKFDTQGHTLLITTVSIASQATDKQVDKIGLSTVSTVDIFLQPIHDIYIGM